MNKLIGLLCILTALFMSSVAVADNESCVHTINLNQQCSGLDLNVDISKIPYFMTDPNSHCDIDLHLPGFPGFNGGGINLNDLSFCGLLKGVVNGTAEDELKHFLPDFVSSPPVIG